VAVSSTHVAKPPETHDVWPCWQLFEHVSEHDAVGFLPEQTIGDAHAVVELTYGQLFESTAHVASVALSWQSVPLCVHADALHAQDALPAPLVVHVWCAPQATAAPHSPLAPHVCTPPAEHCVVFGVHAAHAPCTQTGVAPTHDVVDAL
jgi:hypothetical protein